MFKKTIPTLLIFSSLLPQPCRSDDFSKSETDQNVWSAIVFTSIHQKKDYQKYPALVLAHQYFKQNPQALPTDVLPLINQAEQQYQSAAANLSPSSQVKGEVEAINDAFNAMGAALVKVSPQAAAILPAAKIAIRGGMTVMDRVWGPGQQVTSQFARYSQYSQARENMAAEFRSLWADAQANPNLAATIDLYMAAEINAKIGDSAAVIYKNNPDFAAEESNRRIARAIGPDGTLRISQDELLNMAKDTENELLRGIEAGRNQARLMLQQQSDLMGWLKSRDEAASKRHLEELRTEAASASLFLTTSLIGLVNQDLAKKTNILGSAILQTKNAIDAFNRTGTLLAAGITTFRTAILASNLLTSGLSLMTLFGGGGNDSAILLEQMQGLQRQLTAIGQEMNDRFDAVDRQLNAMYGMMVKQFTLVQHGLGEVNERSLEIQGRLLDLELGISNVGTMLSEGMSQLIKGEYSHAIQNCFDSKSLFRGKTLKLSDYESCLSSIVNYGVKKSKDDSRMQHSNRRPAPELLEAMLEQEIASRSLESKPDFLSIIARSGFGYNLSDANDVLADPIDWAISATSYLRLVDSAPEFIKLLSPQGTEDLIRIGEEIKDAKLKIATVTEGKTLKYSDTLLSRLLENYRQRLEMLRSGIAGEKADYEKTYLGGYDLYSGLDKNEEYRLGTMRACPHFSSGNFLFASPFEVSAPDHLEDQIPAAFQIADRLGLGKLNICADAFILSSKDLMPSMIFVDVRAEYNGKLLLHREFVSQEISIENKSDAERRQILTDYWETSLRKNYMQVSREMGNDSCSGSPNCLPDRASINALLPSVQNAVRESVSTHREALVGRIFSDLRKGNLNPQLQALASAKGLLEAFTANGLPSSFENNDALRGLFLGKKAIYGASEVLENLDLPNLLKQDNEATNRIDALQKVFASLFSSQAVNEYDPLIDGTLKKLEQMKAHQEAILPKASPQEAVDSLRAAMLSRVRF